MIGNIIVYALGVYAISSLVVRYDGPFKLFARIRSQVTGTLLEKVVLCPVCLSTYLATIPALVFSSDIKYFFVYWLGILGAIIVIENFND